LNEILRVSWTLPDPREVRFEVGAQIGTQPCQKRLVRRRVTFEARQHQTAELRLVRSYVHLFSDLTCRFRGGAPGLGKPDSRRRADALNTVRLVGQYTMQSVTRPSTLQPARRKHRTG
jgi:hypothetical protein